MYLNGILILIFFACMAMFATAGLWTNALMLVNVMSSAMLATSLFEPIAGWLQTQMPTYTYFCDFMAIWGVFCVSLVVMRAVTDQLSKVKVRFKRPIDLAGGIFFATWVGWIMICFSLTTLHTAPLSRNFMSGQFQPKPMDHMFFGFAPDRKWLGFVQRMSLGTLSRSGPSPGAHMFDPQGEFILKYAGRRAQFETHLESRVNVK